MRTGTHETRDGLFNAEFYPTPSNIAFRMVQKLTGNPSNFLEPSAGRGDLAEAIKRRFNHRSKVDCIEQSPELVSVLIGKEFDVVGYDWLDFPGVCYYDAIVMNPPFSNGNEHLLKAWDFMHDGQIVCLLNEQTVLNPHTAQRKRLAAIIEEHGTVEYLGNCFDTAVRRADVRVALVHLVKKSNDDTLEMWASISEEKKVRCDIGEDSNVPAIMDNLGNMQHYYDAANEHMLKAIQHMRKASLYLAANGIKAGDDYGKAAALAFENTNAAKAEFARRHRRDAWKNVFDKMDFHKWLDKKQRDEFLRDVEKSSAVPFTADNIKGTLENVFLQRKRLFEKSVANVFDSLTSFFKGNSSHTEGWKTNDSYKVNQKLIFPYGCSYTYGSFNLYHRTSEIDIYSDLDRILCVLSGRDFAQCCTVEQAMRAAFHRIGYDKKGGFDNTTESDFFEIRFFKKGTVHLKFKDAKLWQDFNITAAKGKKWVGENTQARPV